MKRFSEQSASRLTPACSLEVFCQNEQEDSIGDGFASTLFRKKVCIHTRGYILGLLPSGSLNP